MIAIEPGEGITRTGSLTVPLTPALKERLTIKVSVNASIRFIGELSIPTLRRSLAYLMRRHEALRLRAVHTDNEVRHYFVEPVDSYDLPILLARNFDWARDRIRESLLAAIDPENCGTFLAELMTINEQDHILLIMVHALVADDFCVRLIARELMMAYDSYARGEEPAPPPAMRYSEYLLSESQRNKKLTDAQIQHWRSVVDGARHPIPKRNSPSFQSVSRFRYLSASMTSAETDCLSQFASASNVSMATALHALILVAVARHYPTDDLIATVTYSGRDFPALETLVGKTARLFPLRVSMNSGSTLPEFFRQTQAAYMQGAIASRAPPFTSPSGLAQMLGEFRAMATGADAEANTQQGHQLIIGDQMNVQQQLELSTPQLSAQRVALDPRAYDGPEFDPQVMRQTSVFGDGPLIVILRRDLGTEPGRPITFLGGFYTHALAESYVARLLERMCDIARMARPENQHVPIRELSRSVT